MKTSLFVGAATAALLLTSSAFAEKQHFNGNITAAAELPAPTTTACATIGLCTFSFTYDTESHRICGHAAFDKTLNVTQAHIHEGPPTAPGDVIVDLGFSGTTATDQLAFDVTATTQKALVDIPAAFAETDDTVSTIYFNVHTTENGSGEARANIHPDTDPSTKNFDECLEFDADAGTGTDSGTGGPTTTPTDGGGTVITDGGDGTTSSSDDSTSSCSTAPGTSPGSVLLMLGAAIAVGSIVRSRKKR